MARKLNVWTLSGLIVGPILGSGIILLPPLAYRNLGRQAVWAWIATLILGAAFALVFIRMTLRTHSDEGIASLVARERGPVWGDLAANFLSGAVIFGAVPVCLTAARLWPDELAFGLPLTFRAAVIVVLMTLFLLAGLTTISRLTLVLSSATALSLIAASAVAFTRAPVVWQAPDWSTPGLGRTLLLLFWAIVGWEVVANYSKDVDKPEKTVPIAGAIGMAAVSVVYLATALALQTLAPEANGEPTMTTVLVPLFGPAAVWMAGVLGGGLCLATLLMFTGAVTRMTAQRAREGKLPRWLGFGSPDKPPRVSILVLALTSTLLLGAVEFGWIALDGLVATANLFFLGNALLGLTAAWTILKGGVWKTGVIVLGAVLVLLMVQGSPVGWILVAAVAAATFLFRKKAV
jgi:amino acid transporter